MVVKRLGKSCVVLLSKPAIPGRVKTRLIGSLSAEQTAALHRAFVRDVVIELRRGPFDLTLAWAVLTLDDGAEVASIDLEETRGLEAFHQQGDGLGERLHHALAHLAERYEQVAAIGSDHPELSFETVADAFRSLEAGDEVVLGPSEDGGYYLIAARREALTPELFAGVPWSTGAVFASTVERCERLGLRWSQLPMGTDVDLPEDFERLRDRLARGEVDCRQTQALIDSWS